MTAKTKKPPEPTKRWTGGLKSPRTERELTERARRRAELRQQTGKNALPQGHTL